MMAVMKIKVEYPFKPKTNQYLLPGQFLAGLMEWVGGNPPVAEDLVGCKIVEQGSVHIKTIRETGLDGKILGHRPLALAEIEADYFRSQESFDGCMLLKGFKELRPITREE